MQYRIGAIVMLSVCLLAALGARAGETERVGGPGGEQTVRMDCGSNGFITGLYARSGRRIGYDMTLVRDLAVICTSFGGSERSAYPASVRADYAHSQDAARTVQCPKGDYAIYGMSLRAGLYIDRLREAWCRHPTTFPPPPLSIEVGGTGGSREQLACPSRQALYRLDARVGEAIDSLKGYCRVFPPPNPQSVALAAQINASLAPRPPMSLPSSGTSKVLQFHVPDSSLYRSVLFQLIASGTGGMTPSVTYRIDFVDPTGAIMKSSTVSNPVAGVSIHFAKAGTWTLKMRSAVPGATVAIQSILVAAE